MRSLAAHLGEPDAHDRLPFHPSCPICRQTRVTGQMPADGLFSPRAQALLAAGVLGISAAAPGAVAVATEQDQQQDGTAAVGQSGAAHPGDSPEFDPGGDATDLPETASGVPQTEAPADPGNDDAGPIDQTAAANPDDPVIDPGDGSDATATAPATATQPTTAPTDASAAPTTTPTPAPPTTEAPTATPEGAAPVAGALPRISHAERRSHKPVKNARHGATHVAAAPVASAPVPAAATSTTPVAVPVSARGLQAKPGDRAHTVLPGESLWTIATDVLGDDATTAKVAREVHRLWQLNHDRIGTGDPDLLMVGTRLELR
jgi:hypothetical protein